jgi:hypothetical protein
MFLTDEAATRLEVRKHAATIHISGDLNITDRKLVNVLLLNAYDNLLTHKTHQVPVSVLMAMVWKTGQNDALLKEAADRLQSTKVQFNRLNNASGRRRWTSSTLVGEVSIEGGLMIYEYGTELSKAMANPDIYAVINMGIQREFSSQYALALYENCLRFRKRANDPRSGSTGDIEVGIWRELLNATAPMYDEFKHFNNFAIQKAIKEINAHSDIHVTMEKKARGRKVTHIRFTVVDNPQSLLNMPSGDDTEIRESDLFKQCAAVMSADAAIQFIRDHSEITVKNALAVFAEQSRRQVITHPQRYIEGVARKLPKHETASQNNDVTEVPASADDSEANRRRGAWDRLSKGEKDSIIEAFMSETGAATRVAGEYAFRDINEKAAWSGARGKLAEQAIAAR